MRKAHRAPSTPVRFVTRHFRNLKKVLPCSLCGSRQECDCPSHMPDDVIVPDLLELVLDEIAEERWNALPEHERMSLELTARLIQQDLEELRVPSQK